MTKIKYGKIFSGGKIDLAHHANRARVVLDETAELARTVEAVMRLVNLEETLIVVTSDHSHTMTYNGYSKRGHDILGLADLNVRQVICIIYTKRQDVCSFTYSK